MSITHSMSRVGAVVVAAALAAGCGGAATARVAAIKAATTTTPWATAASPLLRERHLREYRRMIVALYRVPGAEALNARYPNPLDQLRISLGRAYGDAAALGEPADPSTAARQ